MAAVALFWKLSSFFGLNLFTKPAWPYNYYCGWQRTLRRRPSRQNYNNHPAPRPLIAVSSLEFLSSCPRRCTWQSYQMCFRRVSMVRDGSQSRRSSPLPTSLIPTSCWNLLFRADRCEGMCLFVTYCCCLRRWRTAPRYYHCCCKVFLSWEYGLTAAQPSSDASTACWKGCSTPCHQQHPSLDPYKQTSCQSSHTACCSRRTGRRILRFGRRRTRRRPWTDPSTYHDGCSDSAASLCQCAPRSWCP